MPKWREVIRNWYFAVRNTLLGDAPDVSQVLRSLDDKQKQLDLETQGRAEADRDSAAARRPRSPKGACLVYVPGKGTGCTVVSRDTCDAENDALRPIGGHATFDGEGTVCP